MNPARWCVSGGWIRLDGRAWCAEPQHWTEVVEDDRRAQWFPTWREAYAYADAMARSGR